MHINVQSLLSSLVVAGALFAAVASTDDNTAERVDDDSANAAENHAGENDTGRNATGENAEDGDAGEDDTFHVGDLVQLGDWQVRVHEVTDPFESSNEYLTPDAGARWVAVDVEVMNTSDEPETVSSIACFELMDGQSRSYTMTFAADSAAPPDGEVAPDGTRRGTIVYEIPEGVSSLRLSFKCDLLSSGSAIIDL